MYYVIHLKKTLYYLSFLLIHLIQSTILLQFHSLVTNNLYVYIFMKNFHSIIPVISVDSFKSVTHTSTALFILSIFASSGNKFN